MSGSYKSVVATLSAAVLIVIGIEFATFAATGDGFILGRANTSATATKLIKRAPGPALVLKSRGDGRPSLLVSSDARVRSLNADLLDGRHARTLASKAVTYRVGRRGDVVPGVGAWSVNPRPGRYHVTFSVVAAPDSSPDQTGGMICGVVDLDTLGPRTRVYAADSGTVIDGDTGIPIAMSGAEMVRIGRTANPGLYCGSNSSAYTLLAASVSLTSISSRTVKTARPATLPFRARRLAARID